MVIQTHSFIFLSMIFKRILFTFLVQGVFLNLKPCVTFERMDKCVFSFTLLAFPWKLFLTESQFVPCLPISHRSISWKPDRDVSADIFEKVKEKTS